jgi:hypothetical protein
MSNPFQGRDGGLAFPYRETEVTGQFQHHYGMSLRDYFAGQALAGMFADPARELHKEKHVAHDAYLFADAMLAAREKQQ